MKWAMLVPTDQLAPILLTNHIDWWGPLKNIPRRLTAFIGDAPIKLLGNAPEVLHIYDDKVVFHPKPIPEAGQWWLGLQAGPYFAMKTKAGRHFRIGFRFDDGEKKPYYTLSFRYKRFDQ